MILDVLYDWRRQLESVKASIWALESGLGRDQKSTACPSAAEVPLFPRTATNPSSRIRRLDMQILQEEGAHAVHKRPSDRSTRSIGRLDRKCFTVTCTRSTFCVR